MNNKLHPFIFVALAMPVQAQVEGLKKCPRIEDPAARLACYDAALPPVVAKPRSASLPSTPTPSNVTSATSTGRSNNQVDEEASFGLQRDSKADELRVIESSTVKDVYGWGPNERFRLQNGQVWQVDDGSSAALGRPASKVVVRRGFFGAFYLQFVGWNISPRVKRVE